MMAENQSSARLYGYGVTLPVRINLLAESGDEAMRRAAAAIELALSNTGHEFSVNGDQAEIVYIDFTTPRSGVQQQRAAEVD